MANLTVALREEISRVARKVIRTELAVIKRNSAYHRRVIAQLKRQITELERQIISLEKQERRLAKTSSSETHKTEGFRFSPARLKAHRKRLGISAAAYASLINVSPLSVYNWEHGMAKPRQSQIAALGEIKSLGKREVKLRLKIPGKKKSK